MWHAHTHARALLDATDRYVARHRYTQTHPDQLSYNAGDVFTAQSKLASGWWFGSVNDQVRAWLGCCTILIVTGTLLPVTGALLPARVPH